MQLPCVIKTVVLTYTINIIIRNQAHRDAFIQMERQLHQHCRRGRRNTCSDQYSMNSKHCKHVLKKTE